MSGEFVMMIMGIYDRTNDATPVLYLFKRTAISELSASTR